MSDDGRFYGKYRGTVVSNIDPMQIGRLMVMVPDVLGTEQCAIAKAAAPLAGFLTGFYALPPVAAGVWVEFEQGDPDNAIWVGCWRGSAADEPPQALLTPPPLDTIVLGTEGQNAIVLSDATGPTGGIMLQTSSGATILMSDTGIVLNAQGAGITLTAKTVDFNVGGLTVN